MAGNAEIVEVKFGVFCEVVGQILALHENSGILVVNILDIKRSLSI
jgi:hypothetical protein